MAVKHVKSLSNICDTDSQGRLQSQYDEHEVEQMRLEQEARRLRDEFEQVEAQRNNEYQQLRAEKELEITRLKGD